MRRFTLLLIFLLAAAALAGCGSKGPLVRPAPAATPAAASSAPAPAGTAPGAQQ